jgi:hypothetical protein
MTYREKGWLNLAPSTRYFYGEQTTSPPPIKEMPGCKSILWILNLNNLASKYQPKFIIFQQKLFVLSKIYKMWRFVPPFFYSTTKGIFARGENFSVARLPTAYCLVLHRLRLRGNHPNLTLAISPKVLNIIFYARESLFSYQSNFLTGLHFPVRITK